MYAQFKTMWTYTHMIYTHIYASVRKFSTFFFLHLN